MQQFEGIIILGIALSIVTAISVARGIYGRVQYAIAQKKRAELEMQQQILRVEPSRHHQQRRRAA
ncbi:MAG: hypothetical protein JNM18_06240 [Planctomycetaceae bacterium]|nr:hypothetical protein [Planctomycetaceae bacterium]